MCRSISPPSCAISPARPIFPVRAWRWSRSPPTRTPRFRLELGKRAATIVFADLPGSSRGRSPAELGALAASLGVASEVEPDPKRALSRGVVLARQANVWLIVTGSLYLIGALRREVGEAVQARI